MRTATLVQLTFPHHGPWGEEWTQASRELARAVREEPGLLWKVWIENEAEQVAGGVCAFGSREDAEAYVVLHRERLAALGIDDVDVLSFDINADLSILSGARPY